MNKWLNEWMNQMNEMNKKIKQKETTDDWNKRNVCNLYTVEIIKIYLTMMRVISFTSSCSFFSPK